MEKHPLHLKMPELQSSDEVEMAVEKKERISGEVLPNNPTDRIEAYIDRLEQIFLNENEDVRRRNVEILRDSIYNFLIIKREDVPESYFELQKRIARERGQHIEAIPDEERERLKDSIIEDQISSIDQWINYLMSPAAAYPSWFKYLVWRNIIRLSKFDKEAGRFLERTKSTVAPFPEIFPEPIALIRDVYEKVAENNKNLKTDPELQRQFSKSFAKLYAEFVLKFLSKVPEKNKEKVRGEWVKYKQGDMADAEKLCDSLQGKGTDWCTSGRATAKDQINSGDFFVYYTYDKDGRSTEPRLAISMNGKNISQIAGILPGQQPEGVLGDVLDKKMNKFGPEADAYRKKIYNMKQISLLERKTNARERLSKDELTFLYEINAPIEDFGDGDTKDPRIEEIILKRNPKDDASVIFDCDLKDVAETYNEITAKTKVYIGALFPGIFETGVEHIYSPDFFSENKVERYQIETGSKPKETLLKEIEDKNIVVSSELAKLMASKDFMVSPIREKIRLVSMTVETLGFPRGAKTDLIYKRIKELGLDLCSIETALHLRLLSQTSWFAVLLKRMNLPEFRQARAIWICWGGFQNRQPAMELETGSGFWRANYPLVLRLQKK